MWNFLLGAAVAASSGPAPQGPAPIVHRLHHTFAVDLFEGPTKNEAVRERWGMTCTASAGKTECQLNREELRNTCETGGVFTIVQSSYSTAEGTLTVHGLDWDSPRVQFSVSLPNGEKIKANLELRREGPYTGVARFLAKSGSTEFRIPPYDSVYQLPCGIAMPGLKNESERAQDDFVKGLPDTDRLALDAFRHCIGQRDEAIRRFLESRSGALARYEAYHAGDVSALTSEDRDRLNKFVYRYWASCLRNANFSSAGKEVIKRKFEPYLLKKDWY